ncbi:MAG: cell wall-active antibiotics response protein [Clostridiaceae bacterium]|nr:cell wall-active antibiotics response protein [Clostridiaceae bacterium]
MRKKSVIGLILILTGIAWIINLTGFIHVDWSKAIKTLWPLILIAIGVSMVAGRYKLVTTVVWILTFAIFIGFGIYQKDENNHEFKKERADHREYVDIKKTPAEDEIAFDSITEEGKLIIDLDTVKINVEGADNSLLAKLNTNIPNLEQQLATGKQAVLKYITQDYEKGNIVSSFDLQINQTIPWEIDTTLSVVDGRLNLSKIPANKLNLKLGVGDLELIVGKQQEHTVINIQAGATDLDIYIPEDVGLMVKSGKLLTKLSFHNINMTNQDNVYVSENYDKANQKVEMHIQSAVSTIEIFAE